MGGGWAGARCGGISLVRTRGFPDFLISFRPGSVGVQDPPGPGPAAVAAQTVGIAPAPGKGPVLAQPRTPGGGGSQRPGRLGRPCEGRRRPPGYARDHGPPIRNQRRLFWAVIEGGCFLKLAHLKPPRVDTGVKMEWEIAYQIRQVAVRKEVASRLGRLTRSPQNLAEIAGRPLPINGGPLRALISAND